MVFGLIWVANEKLLNNSEVVKKEVFLFQMTSPSDFCDFYGCAFDLYGSKFSHLLATRAEGADLSTSLLTVKADCKKKTFFTTHVFVG